MKSSAHPKRRYRNGVSRPVFIVKLTDGLAAKHRLSLDHVLRVLTEVKGMIEEAGRRLQREHGADKTTGDFGLELEAGFRRGSIQANILITKDIEIGAQAASQVIQTIQHVSPKWRRSQRRRQATVLGHTDLGELDPKVLARLNNIGKMQEIDHTKMKLQLRNGDGRSVSAVFDQASVDVVAKYQEANFAIEGITLFGRLRELKDLSEEEEGQYFTGELLLDGHDVWRIKFKARDKEKAAMLWSKQVWVTGQALYYRAASPRLVAADFGHDEERDYEAAFDELYGLNADLYKADLKTLLRELRGGE